MALSLEEEQELAQLEQEQSDLSTQLNSIKEQHAKSQQVPIAQEGLTTSMPEAFARGAAQELTFGYPDEITAGLESTFTPKTYDQALAESRAEYALGEEEHPIATLAGGLTGGAAQMAALSMAAPGAGTAASAGGLVNKLRQAAGMAKGVLMPAKELGIGKNIAKGAMSGAAFGGATATGRSEKDGLERLYDVPAGATSGAVIGGALGGIGAGIGKAGEAISKKIDTGEAPYSFKMIRDAWRMGKEGKGLSTMKAKSDIDESLMDAAKSSTKDVQDTLGEMRTVRNAILNNIHDPISVQSHITGLGDTLANLTKKGLDDATDAFKKVDLNIPESFKETGEMSVSAANELNSAIYDIIQNNPEYHSSVKKALSETMREIKQTIRMNVDGEKAYITLRDNNPDLIPVLEKYVKNIPHVPDIADSAIDDKKFFTNLKASVKRKNANLSPAEQAKVDKGLENIITKLKTGAVKKPYETKPTPSNQEDLESILLGAKDVAAQKAKESPLQSLDTGMHGILNASEILGDVTSKGSEKEKLGSIFAMFRNMYGQTKDTQSGKIATEKYRVAMEQLEKAHPELAARVKASVEAPLGDYEVKKFSEGASLGESGMKESGLLKSAMQVPGSLIAGGANIAGQFSGAAKAGLPSPLPAASSMLRPTTSVMQSIKSGVDAKLAANPNSKAYKMFSESLDKALNENDEGRRAAILNTLMQ